MQVIKTIQLRAREIGRIRLGDKGPKGEPRKLESFRFTSHNRSAIESIARLYGGEVKACNTADLVGQYEATTEAQSIPVSLPPQEPSQYMESWSGGGCTRRCDGETELLSGKPCQCRLMNSVICSPTTRMSFILPQVPDLGVWRLETHGWNAAQELIGSYMLLTSLAGGVGRNCILSVEKRTSKTQGKTKRFVVPVLRIESSLDALMPSPADETAKTSLPRNGVSDAVPSLPGQADRKKHLFALFRDMELLPYDANKELIMAGTEELLGFKSSGISQMDPSDIDRLSELARAVKIGEIEAPEAWKKILIGKAQGGGE